MLIRLPDCVVRDWSPDDAPSLARYANDRRIWLNLRDAFPHPYGVADAHAFLERAAAMSPRTYFAIAVAGQAAGSATPCTATWSGWGPKSVTGWASRSGGGAS